jgi:hypothetical protein
LGFPVFGKLSLPLAFLIRISLEIHHLQIATFHRVSVALTCLIWRPAYEFRVRMFVNIHARFAVVCFRICNGNAAFVTWRYVIRSSGKSARDVISAKDFLFFLLA